MKPNLSNQSVLKGRQIKVKGAGGMAVCACLHFTGFIERERGFKVVH